ncbi:MAG: hypothetical protein ACI4NA_07325 [Succinivibrio sp.]
MRVLQTLCAIACAAIAAQAAAADGDAARPEGAEQAAPAKAAAVKAPDAKADSSFEQSLREFQAADRPIPCPNGWVVEPNPSADNSLSYMTEDGTLAVSVTSIKAKDGTGIPTEPESYARVAAEQMSCSIPVRSNLIDGGWTFHCNDYKVDGLVYGSKDELVLLGISGRSADTESRLTDFVRFLQFQAAGD